MRAVMRNSVTTFLKRPWVVPVFLLTALVVAYFSFNLLRGSGIQTDEALKTAYMKNRDSFSKLERLFADDPTLLYASSSTFYRNHGEGRVSDTETPEEYRLIFDQTGIQSGVRDRVIDVDFISFSTFRIKLEGGDFSEEFYEEKGYALILAPDEKVRELLGTGKTYGNVKFRQVEQHWYTYHRIQVSKPE